MNNGHVNFKQVMKNTFYKGIDSSTEAFVDTK